MRARGFTLLELLVVIAIFAVFSLMAYGGLERTATAQKAYLRLRDDFQQLRNRPARDGYGDLQPPLRTDSQGRIELTRGGWRNPLLLPRPGLERVSYRLDGKKLKRESWRVLDQAQDSKPVELVLLDDVQDVRWRLLDKDRAWQERWPPEAAGSNTAPAPLPLAVELQIDSKHWGRLTFLFRLGVEQPTLTEFASGTPNPQQRPSGQPPSGGENPPPVPPPPVNNDDAENDQ